MEINDMIAEWVRSARVAANLSGADLGARLALRLGTERGHTKANISHWENGKHSPSLEQLIAIVYITEQPLPSAILEKMGAVPTGAVDGERPAASRAPAAPRTPLWMDPEAYELLSLYFSLDKTERGISLESIRGLAGERGSRVASNDS